jgi:hypothetical protein
LKLFLDAALDSARILCVVAVEPQQRAASGAKTHDGKPITQAGLVRSEMRSVVRGEVGSAGRQTRSGK